MNRTCPHWRRARWDLHHDALGCRYCGALTVTTVEALTWRL